MLIYKKYDFFLNVHVILQHVFKMQHSIQQLFTEHLLWIKLYARARVYNGEKTDTVLALAELTVQWKYFELYSILIYTYFLLFLIWYSDSLKCSFVGGHSGSSYFAVTTNIITNILAYLY